jgi:hypothetical protein
MRRWIAGAHDDVIWRDALTGRLAFRSQAGHWGSARSDGLESGDLIAARESLTGRIDIGRYLRR